MNSNNNTRSSAELQQEVRSSLSDVIRDVGQLKTRMSPGQLIDDAIFYPHKGNPALTFEHLKRNPIGSTFLAIGTMLLMEDESHVSYEKSVGTKVGEVATKTRGKVTQVSAEAREKIDGLKSKVTASVDQVRTDLHNKLDTAKSKVAGVKEGIESQVSGIKEDVVNRIEGITELDTSNLSGDVKGKISTTIDSARKSVKEMDPMAYMAIGIGLGALSGAAIPVSGREQKLVDENLGGRMADFKRECQDALHQSYDVLKKEFMVDASSFDLNRLKGVVGIKNESRNA